MSTHHEQIRLGKCFGESRASNAFYNYLLAIRHILLLATKRVTATVAPITLARILTLNQIHYTHSTLVLQLLACYCHITN